MKRILLSSIVALVLALVAYAQQGALFQQDVSWSPDGNYIAFCGMHDFDQAAHTFKADIYVMRADGSGLTKISSDEKNEFYLHGPRTAFILGSRRPERKTQIFIRHARMAQTSAR